MEQHTEFTVKSGMEVLGSDGDRVGAVKGAQHDYFLVDRSLARDLYIPYSAIERVEGNAVILNLTDEEAPNMGWEDAPERATAPPAKPPVKTGMEVVGSDGDAVGYVSEVYDTAFRVDRPMAGDVSVPYDAVQEVFVNRVVLTIPDQQVDYMRWTGTPEH